MSIAVFQAAAREQAPSGRLNWLELAAERAAKGGAALLVCPELYVTGYLAGEGLRRAARPAGGDHDRRVGEIAALNGIAIAFTYPEIRGGALFNTAVLAGADGEILLRHRKNHVPEGYERDYFTADDAIRVVQLGEWTVGLLVGYDLEFPEGARHAALQGADLLLVPTALSDDWAFIAEHVAPARAWENGLFVALANWAGSESGTTYLGGSRVIGPEGRIDAQARTGEQILMAEIDRDRVALARRRNPYLADRRSYGD